MGAALCTCGESDNTTPYLPRKQPRKLTLTTKYHYATRASHTQRTLELSEGTSDHDFFPAPLQTLLAPILGEPVQSTTDAFRAKLKEPSMSPRSKLTWMHSRQTTLPLSGSDELPTFLEESEPESDDQCLSETTHTPEELIEPVDDAVLEEKAKRRHSVIVPPGPCGLILQVNDSQQGPPVVEGFVSRVDGRKGTIENSGIVRRGSLLSSIDGQDVSTLRHDQVIQTLNATMHRERELAFLDP